jgi:hypothetical protein
MIRCTLCLQETAHEPGASLEEEARMALRNARARLDCLGRDQRVAVIASVSLVDNREAGYSAPKSETKTDADLIDEFRNALFKIKRLADDVNAGRMNPGTGCDLISGIAREVLTRQLDG